MIDHPTSYGQEGSVWLTSFFYKKKLRLDYKKQLHCRYSRETLKEGHQGLVVNNIITEVDIEVGQLHFLDLVGISLEAPRS